MNHLAPLFVAAVGVLLATPAQAAECWQVTGWATTAPPGWGTPTGAIERASLVPAECDVTPPGYRWLHIVREFSALDPAPTDLYVLAPHESSSRSDGFELYRGLTWQGRYSVFPILWRAWREHNLVFDLRAPTPATPEVGAVVALRQRDTGYCAWNGGLAWSAFLYLDFGGVNGCDSVNPASGPSWLGDAAYEIVDAGTNGLGQPLVRFEHLHYATCSYLEDYYGQDLVRHDACSLDQSGYDMQLVPVTGGGYRIRSEDTGLCYGTQQSNNGYLHSASCASASSVYDVVTILRAPVGGGGPPPGEEEM